MFINWIEGCLPGLSLFELDLTGEVLLLKADLMYLLLVLALHLLGVDIGVGVLNLLETVFDCFDFGGFAVLKLFVEGV